MALARTLFGNDPFSCGDPYESVEGGYFVSPVRRRSSEGAWPKWTGFAVTSSAMQERLDRFQSATHTNAAPLVSIPLDAEEEDEPSDPCAFVGFAFTDSNSGVSFVALFLQADPDSESTRTIAGRVAIEADPPRLYACEVMFRSNHIQFWKIVKGDASLDGAVRNALYEKFDYAPVARLVGKKGKYARGLRAKWADAGAAPMMEEAAPEEPVEAGVIARPRGPSKAPSVGRNGASGKWVLGGALREEPPPDSVIRPQEVLSEDSHRWVLPPNGVYVRSLGRPRQLFWVDGVGNVTYTDTWLCEGRTSDGAREFVYARNGDVEPDPNKVYFAGNNVVLVRDSTAFVYGMFDNVFRVGEDVLLTRDNGTLEDFFSEFPDPTYFDFADEEVVVRDRPPAKFSGRVHSENVAQFARARMALSMFPEAAIMRVADHPQKETLRDNAFYGLLNRPTPAVSDPRHVMGEIGITLDQAEGLWRMGIVNTLSGGEILYRPEAHEFPIRVLSNLSKHDMPCLVALADEIHSQRWYKGVDSVTEFKEKLAEDDGIDKTEHSRAIDIINTLDTSPLDTPEFAIQDPCDVYKVVKFPSIGKPGWRPRSVRIGRKEAQVFETAPEDEPRSAQWSLTLEAVDASEWTLEEGREATHLRLTFKGLNGKGGVSYKPAENRLNFTTARKALPNEVMFIGTQIIYFKKGWLPFVIRRQFDIDTAARRIRLGPITLAERTEERPLQKGGSLSVPCSNLDNDDDDGELYIAMREYLVRITHDNTDLVQNKYYNMSPITQYTESGPFAYDRYIDPDKVVAMGRASNSLIEVDREEFVEKKGNTFALADVSPYNVSLPPTSRKRPRKSRNA